MSETCQETGCGKTTVVQLLREILDRGLHIINCHATTETSDLIGGLRPVRGRGAITLEIQTKLREFLSLYPDKDALGSIALPKFLSFPDENMMGGANPNGLDSDGVPDLPEDAVPTILNTVDTLYGRLKETHESTDSGSDKSLAKEAKKRKLASGASIGVSPERELDNDILSALKELVDDIRSLARRLSCLFEWADGPLVHAMRTGQLLLLDEMSLAEDAVLERLNSVLEPSRTLVLAEKGTDAMDEGDDNTVVGHDNFRIFATMNPGGDYGKRELSPALRSRFTEIWVPQVTDPSDIEMVLSHTLASISMRCDRATLQQKILNYVDFFNVSICGSKSSPCADLALSLRDVLAWARFVVDVSNCNNDMDPWAMYCHGACLMHLDGLGLGTGLSVDDASSTKRKAIAFLLDQVPIKERSTSTATFSADLRRGLVTEKRFGIPPFTIETGAYPIPDSTFDFDAPTPSLNLLRVLRAMQISKPILLEGSPGVGKTSLAAALAAASGHRLVRINLSEQTDMSDLMGSDLPNPEHAETTGGSSFTWCDGVLLRAIKRGDWVLLDELNLASQSVLEGLNSCLDHRASVFIPELGKTFHCPPSFRIFAAQNPLAQGGGRKGLPKSFLNRFTKVYVESLTEDDLHSIVSSRFPAVSASLAKSMILFNKKVHEEVVDRHEYGDGGSPWEFNLRDVFRWCELVVAKGGANEEQLARFARHLYLQRFRTEEDRRRLDCSYQEYFGISLFELPLPELSVTDERVSIGSAVLDRQLLSMDMSSGQLLGGDSVVVRSLLYPLEAVVNCITMKWPCLLVGVSGSGKSSLLNSLAELCNASLVTVSLTPATDVNELVGSFEQVDSDEDRKEVIRHLRLLNNAACTYLTETQEELALQHEVWRLHRSIENASLKDLTASGLEIVSLLVTASDLNQEFRQCTRAHLESSQLILKRLEATLADKAERDKRHFRWVEGILVAAMTQGHWLHLENVNLCPASVLDRLNPVMEKDGELLLTECGVKDSETSGTNLQTVKQHPNFRVFLSMNPEHGEISRAMRNRCVEISLIPSSSTQVTPLMSPNKSHDCHDSLYSAGVRSMQVATSLLEMHDSEIGNANDRGTEIVSTKHLREWGRLVTGLRTRGMNFQSSFETSYRVSYELSKDQLRTRLSRQMPWDSRRDCTSLMQVPSIRWGWSFSPDQARLDLEMRLVKVCVGCNETSSSLRELLLGASTEPVKCEQPSNESAVGLHARHNPDRFSAMQASLLALYLDKSELSDLSARSRTLDGYSDTSADHLRLMASLLGKVIAMLPPSAELTRDRNLMDTFSYRSVLQDDVIVAVHLHRLAQLLREREAYAHIAVLDNQSMPTHKLSALETSVCLSEGRIDRSLVSCPVTPMLYPFFRAFDEWIYHLVSAPENVEWARRHAEKLESLLSRRDQLWLCLQLCNYNSTSASRFLGFDESGFIVQWIWLKKRIGVLSSSNLSLNSRQDPLLKKLKLQVDILIEALDRVLFNTGDGLSQSTDALWKKGGHPLVPRQAIQWEAMALLNQMAQECALWHASNCGDAQVSTRVDLHNLIEKNSPALFLGSKKKGELLAALSMCFWASTDEVQGSDRIRSLHENQQLSHAICDELDQRRKAFEAQVRASQVDIEIKTVENMLDVEALSNLRERAGPHGNKLHDEDFLLSLLFRFAQIQASPLAEFWCVQEEMALIETLSEALLSSPDADAVLGRVRSFVPRFRIFIDVVLTQTCLAVVDVRPYQTLVWAASDSGAKAESIMKLLQCLIPRMMNALSRHQWYNSFNDLDVISEKLEMPSLWADETNSSESSNMPKGDIGLFEFRRGPPRLDHCVKSEVIFRFIGPTVSSMLNIARSSTYATIENQAARKTQAQGILNTLSILKLPSNERRDEYQLRYLFAHSIEALSDFFPSGSGNELLSILRDSEALQNVDEDYLFGLVGKCEHPAFRECSKSVVFPLLSSLRSTNGALPDEKRALCWIYVGLLRMSLLVPWSPLDPGKKPIAKVIEHDRYLDTLEGERTALCLDSVLVRGVPPDDPRYHRLLEETKRIIDKRLKQEGKRVERSVSAPPFIDLFRESRQFYQSAVAPEGVPALIRAISEASQDEMARVHAARSRESNWQATSSSFCTRLLRHFAAYEDVALPFVNAIQNVRDGIRLLAVQHLSPSESRFSPRASVTNSLLAFPSGNVFAGHGLSALISNTNAIATQPGNFRPGDLSRCRFALSLALLCRMDVQKRLRGGKLVDSAVSESHLIFNSVAVAWSNERDGASSDSPECAEALLEEEYREQFPDHGKEFQSLLHSIEMDEELDLPEMERTEVPEEDWQLADDQIAILCSLHRDLYLPGGRLMDGRSRTRALCAGYSASYYLAHLKPMASTDGGEQVGAHIAALALCSGPGDGNLFDHESCSDFHRAANPSEVARASRPLEMLIARISQLLSAFPGNSVLIALVRVADHCRKLPLSTTSVGKAMHGLEIILRKAQEWEQHASSHVKLGTPLLDISELVACWRKLELQSWGTLLEARGLRFAKRARKHWPRLYNVLIKSTEQKEGFSPCARKHWSVEAPNWVWKGLKADVLGMFDVSVSQHYDTNVSLFDLSRVMDTFLLTSSLGEFKERLTLVETFANQISMMHCQSGNVEPSQVQVGRMLFSLLSFYRQFLPMLDSRLVELRRPIEARLKDEVKLAKWDEQSYYALRESTEKNHRKLMKLLREYDDVLELSVSSILERHLCNGVRNTETSSEEPCSSVPPSKALFPVVNQTPSGGSKLDVSSVDSQSSMDEDRAWADPERAGLNCDKYVSQMAHYARRMTVLLKNQQRDSVPWARVGTENVSELCETIFERIDSLRKENTTKTMKQRALVDLFKTLKQNGFLQTKWSIPEQVREMAHLLQLPGLIDTENDILPAMELEALDGAERYFQRTTAEVNRLRSEVQMLGSKHMSQRETQIMLSLAEHGLTMMCQQRCVLATLLKQVSSLDTLTKECNAWDSLPIGQTNLRRKLEEFHDAFFSVVENLNQLQHLLKTASPLIKDTDRTEAVRDMVSVVDSCISSLGDYGVEHVPTILTSVDISRMTGAGRVLEEIGQLVCGCQQSCEKSRCLPPEVFTSCITEIERARSISSGLSSEALPSDGGGVANASSIMDGASLVVQKVLLAVQVLCKDTANPKSDEDEDRADEAIFGCHSSAIREFAAIDLNGVVEASSAVIKMVGSLHEVDAVAVTQRDCCTSVVSGASTLVRKLLEVSRQRLFHYIQFSRSLAKLNYVLARVFRVLVSKGYCADSISDDADGDGGGDISGMNFEDDKEGTGMGEGDGKQDVTDQLESEEQLLGLKGQDQDDAPTEQQESKELNEEEAQQGMEMEGDFEGDMFDVPEQSQDDDKDDDGDDEEELDREMGDGPDQNEDIIDEKMWDQSDDEGEQDPADEKFEKDSGVKGESLEDELRTREDDESQKGGDTKDDSNDAKPSERDNAGDEEAMQDEPEINEDLEDNYEEKAAGVDVRDEQNDAENGDDDDNGDEPMELEDGLNLDEGSDGESVEGGDAMDIEDPAVEDPPEEDDNAESNLVADEGTNESDPELSEVDADVLESGGHKNERNGDEEAPEENGNEGDNEVPEVEFSGNDGAPQDVQGIQSKDGKDNITEKMDEDEQGEGNDGKDDNDDSENAVELPPQTSSGGTSGEGGDAGDQGESSREGETEKQEQDSVSAPNPFQNPGDATKFWHKKLRMLEGGTEGEDEEAEAHNDDVMDEKGDGEFEFAPKDQASSTQVLGEADEVDAAPIDEQDEEGPDESEDHTKDQTKSPEGKESCSKERKRSENTGRKSGADQQKQGNEEDSHDSDGALDEGMEDQEAVASDADAAENDGEAVASDELGNRVVTDLSQLHVSGEAGQHGRSVVEDEGHTRITDAEAAAARSEWSRIQGETHHLARRLCEKLRLVMEPLVATKLRGDYRTGKRINMKRVIGYIASGYRKDKIWLRRTKPAKRNYRVLLAVDNSESMHKSGAGEMALAAMATLAEGMSQLEIGELGVASFGEEMRLLHPFQQPFTSESGVNVVQNFPFDEKRTRTALCVESAISALESQGDASSMQLVFLISDGRIERDSRDALRRLVREMVERNVLLVMIIVEGDKNGPTKKKDSIVHMKEVTFKNGKPSVKQFIEDYPFPYYMVLKDMQTLPELLGGALSQWFEMLAQIQGTSR
jgi:MoxR-like ATPase